MVYFWWVHVIYLGLFEFSYTEANDGGNPCAGWSVGWVNSTTISCDYTFVGAM